MNLMPLSRRRALQLLAAAATIERPHFISAQPPAIFEIVPPETSGITWVHDNARSPEHWLPESMCSGCAFLDYDNDGWMDIFLVNTGNAPFFHPAKPPRNALYRNNRDGTFTDVTARAGLDSGRWGEGVAVGDYNADGLPDIYLTCYGNNILYRNNGDGTFTDVTRKAGVQGAGWSTSAIWFDYDNDGNLDLFVCAFVDYNSPTSITCGDNKLGKRFYCIPKVFEGRRSGLYHNNGDGTFTEVGRESDIGKNLGKAHGVVVTDVNGDGRLDLWVSNDTVANYLYLNRGGGKFEEIGLAAGVAYADNGQARSGMGVDSADYDNDGRLDLFVANIDRERFSIYHNDGGNKFTDQADTTPIGRTSYFLSGWGLKFFDYDNDGNQDLFLSNGHPDDMVETYAPKVTWAEPLLLFHNDGAAWRDVSAQAGPAFQRRWPARGLAVGDFDNDGAVDVLINNNGAPPLLLRNRAGARNNWLGVKLVGTKANIDGIGTWVTWAFAGKTRSLMKGNGGSYLSAHDPRLVLGVGQATKIDSLVIKWPLPSGLVERIAQVPLNRYITIVEGKGIVGETA
jgi:enediyne biosynthesis protein E4